MATDLSFVEYLRDQTNASGRVSFKKMFGEYALYFDEKVVALVCDNQLFVRPSEAGRALLVSVVEAAPYPGAKPHFAIVDQVNDKDWMSRLIEATASELPAPKSKKPKPKT